MAVISVTAVCNLAYSRILRACEGPRLGAAVKAQGSKEGCVRSRLYWVTKAGIPNEAGQKVIHGV